MASHLGHAFVDMAQIYSHRINIADLGLKVFKAELTSSSEDTDIDCDLYF